MRRAATYCRRHCIAIAAVLIALSGSSYAAVGLSSDSKPIYACYANKGGALRIVSANTKCNSGETALSWNQQLAPGTVTPSDFGTIPAASVTISTKESVQSGSRAILVFDKTEFDTDHVHQHPGSLIAPVAGIYEVNLTVSWAFASDQPFVGIYKNDQSVEASDWRTSNGRVGDPTNESISCLVKLAAGNFVDAEVAQDSGAPVNVQTGATRFSMVWVAPSH